MLGCISDMVEKTRRALTVLQMRQQDTIEPQRTASVHRPSAYYPNRPDDTPVSSSNPAATAATVVDLKRNTHDLMAQALQFTEERVAEVRRKAGNN
jgi:hypothetical protein